jgi:hypothetical protein
MDQLGMGNFGISSEDGYYGVSWRMVFIGG